MCLAWCLRCAQQLSNWFCCVCSVYSALASTPDPAPADPSESPRHGHPNHTARAFAAQHLLGAQQLLRESVAPSTRARYASGWRHWVSFIHQAVANPRHDDLLPAHLHAAAMVPLLLAFIHFLYADRHLSASAIKVALSGVRHEFQASALEVEAFSDPRISAARRALGRVAPAKPRGKRIPFSLEMVLSFAAYASRTNNPQHHMNAIAAQLGYFCLMRASEYLVTDSDRHTLRSKAVEFECSVPGSSSTRLLAAHEVHSVPFHRIRAVRVSSLSAKNIRPGSGQASWFSTRPASSRQDFCLVRSLYDWACRAQLRAPDDYFLSLPNPCGPRIALRYEALSAAISAVARSFDLDPSRCGTHSFRRGGATSLISAGAPAPLLMQAGRWKSPPVAASYPERTSRSNDQQLHMLLSPSALSLRDIRMAQCLPQADLAAPRRRSSQRASKP